MKRLLALVFLATIGCKDRQTVRSTWRGGVPLVVDANGDGVEDMVSFGNPFRMYDGKTFAPLWERKDLEIFGSPSALVGRSLVLGRDRALTVLDVATGQTTATVPLSDEATSLCADGDAVWVSQSDRVSGSFRPGATKLDTAATVPASCVARRTRPSECKNGLGACTTYRSRDLTLTDGSRTVHVVRKDPGTPEVTLLLRGNAEPDSAARHVAFDPTGKRLGAVDMSRGLVFLQQTGKLTAVDAATGATRWTYACSTSSDALRVTATRVYVECDGWKSLKALRVLDHDTGARLGALGEPRNGG